METPAFEAAEAFLIGTTAAALVPLWLLAVCAHLAEPYAKSTSGRFGLRLGSEMWLALYAGLRDAFTLAVFLLSFMYFYPDAVAVNQLPIAGPAAATLALAALVAKLVSDSGRGRRAGLRFQTVLLGVGAVLYIGCYLLGPELTGVNDSTAHLLAPILTSSRNPTLALAICHTSQEISALLGLGAVVYVLRQPLTRPSQEA